MQPNQRPLPESLTRYLAAPPRRSAKRVPLSADSRPRAVRQGSAHAALEAALLRGFVYGVSGLVWLVVTALVLHHFLR